MTKKLLSLSVLSAMLASNAMAMNNVHDEVSLRQAIAAANEDSSIKKIKFARDAEIVLTAPVIYNGSQALELKGNGAVIDGSSAGSFELDENLTAVTNDGTLVFNTANSVTIKNLTVKNSATRGIVVNIPQNALGDDSEIKLHKVKVLDSALFGVHIDDNLDEFDDGTAGSSIGLEIEISHSEFVGNGTGALDFDGVRADERGAGSIKAEIRHTIIDGNGGDGIELDEGGPGDVEAKMNHVSISDNGFFNPADLDDGFDIDEEGEGDLKVEMKNIQANNNKDEGLDFDEKGEGDVELKLRRVQAENNTDEGIKADEEDGGDIEAELTKVKVLNSGDDGIQLTELGEGDIEAALKKVTANDNAKYGIKIEQWVVEDEANPAEEAGSIKTRKVTLSGNGNGDEIKLNNVVVE